MIERYGSRIALSAVGVALSWALVIPAPAFAHGLVGRTDLPIPRWLFAWAAALVLVISFLALAALWPRPRLEQVESRRIGRVPLLLDPLAGLIGVALYALVIYAGFAGHQTANTNIAPTFIYVLFWVGLAFAAFLFGDVFRAFNPWRAIARGAAAAARRGRSDALAPRRVYPAWLGRWPAVAGIAGFAWLELVYTQKTVPQTLAVLALAYGGVQLVGMRMYGIETWTSRGDGFSAYFGVFARLSPLDWRDRHVYLRPPFVGAIGLEMIPGTVALLATMIGATSFDGFSVGSTWLKLQPHIESVFSDLGASPNVAIELAGTTGLAAMILIIGSFYRLGVLGMRSVSDDHTAAELGRKFAHSLVPIALAYVTAHYFSLLAFQGQAVGYLVSDPLGNGSDIFGTAGASIDYSVVSANAIWYVQVGALVIGHAAGLTLAHDRALVLFKDPRDSLRSQYWMLAVMVTFTSLGLWILSSTR